MPEADGQTGFELIPELTGHRTPRVLAMKARRSFQYNVCCDIQKARVLGPELFV